MLAAHSPGHAPASTNRVLVLTRTIFNCALRWETPGITKNATDKATLLPVNNERERFLDANEMRRLFRALDDSDAKMLKHIIAMLMLTGARKSEVLNAKWLDFDLINFSWRIEFNKSGKTRYVPLSHNAVALIKQLPTIPGCEYAFANPKTKRPFVSIYNSWNTARKKQVSVTYAFMISGTRTPHFWLTGVTRCTRCKNLGPYSNQDNTALRSFEPGKIISSYKRRC